MKKKELQKLLEEKGIYKFYHSKKRIQECPDPYLALDYLSGLFAKEEREEVLKHIINCPHCYSVLIEELSKQQEKTKTAINPILSIKSLLIRKHEFRWVSALASTMSTFLQQEQSFFKTHIIDYTAEATITRTSTAPPQVEEIMKNDIIILRIRPRPGARKEKFIVKKVDSHGQAIGKIIHQDELIFDEVTEYLNVAIPITKKFDGEHFGIFYSENPAYSPRLILNLVKK